jgi:hypothetical protein
MNEAVSAAAPACPSCRAPMRGLALEQNYRGTVPVQVCFECAGIWFEHSASSQLAPGGVIELFKQVQAGLNAPRRALAEPLRCPRCTHALALSSDLCRTGRFTYYRCPDGDGRFTPFFQFLREKQFVRSLSEAEIERLRAQVRQISCSGCGAPIDLAHDTVCAHCHTAVSFLDPEAVEKAIHQWADAQQHATRRPSAQEIGDALLNDRAPGANPATGGWPALDAAGFPALSEAGVAVDLVTFGVEVIASLFRHGI